MIELTQAIHPSMVARIRLMWPPRAGCGVLPVALPRVLTSKLELPALAFTFLPRPKIYVTVTWKLFRFDKDTKKAFYSIDMNSIKGLMPCKVTGGAPVDFETFKYIFAAPEDLCHRED
jgi:hypothetical protein